MKLIFFSFPLDNDEEFIIANTTIQYIPTSKAECIKVGEIGHISNSFAAEHFKKIKLMHLLTHYHPVIYLQITYFSNCQLEMISFNHISFSIVGFLSCKPIPSKQVLKYSETSMKDHL